MKSEVAPRGSREDVRKSAKAQPPPAERSCPPPQPGVDPEKRRDFFNRLLEKYSTKSTKVGCGATQLPYQRSRITSVSTPKAPTKLKDKMFKKKRSNSDKNLVRSSTQEDVTVADEDEAWKCSVQNHVNDPSIYKNHQRIRARFPFPMPSIQEDLEPDESEESDTEASKSGEVLVESVNHSFTLLPCGDQNNVKNGDYEIHYEEQILTGPNPLPEELQRRHVTRTSSGTLVWVGNDIIHELIQKKGRRGSLEEFTDRRGFMNDRPAGVGDKSTGVGDRSAVKSHRCTGLGEKPTASDAEIKTVKHVEDSKCSGEGEEQQTLPSVKSSSQTRLKKVKSKKNASSPDVEDCGKGSKHLDTRCGSVPSSSSSSCLNRVFQVQEESKIKKFTEKVKKPKKLTKKQTFTLVTSKNLL